MPTKTFEDLIQLGDPVEHRSIVIAPLFPAASRRRATSRSRRPSPSFSTSRRSTRPARCRSSCVQSPRVERPALRRRGARRRQAEPDSHHHRARSGAERDPHSRLVRRGRPVERSQLCLLVREAHRVPDAAASQGRDAVGRSDGTRRGAGGRVGRGQREGGSSRGGRRRPCAGRHLPLARGRGRRASARVPARRGSGRRGACARQVVDRAGLRLAAGRVRAAVSEAARRVPARRDRAPGRQACTRGGAGVDSSDGWRTRRGAADRRRASARISHRLRAGRARRGSSSRTSCPALCVHQRRKRRPVRRRG